jgi:signal transduction histidine kinase
MKSKAILLVDDEKIILKTIRKDLRAEGYDVTTAENGESAIATLKQQHFDLVITDLVMEGLDGFQVLKQATKIDPELPVIILTGHGDMTSAIRALRLGADDYILKPCDIDELFVRMSHCFEKQDLLEQLKVQNEQLLDEIAARKQAEEALEQSSEKIKLFAYSVAHDLKNPSIAIYGLTKRLQEKHGDSLTEKGKIYCNQIQKSAEQIAALVETINQYIATKEKPLQLEDVNPQEVFQIIREEFAARLNIRQISLFVPSNVPEIKADKLSIFRVFRNFVDNALKYGGETLSKIKIRYQDTDDCHIFSVSDNGIGLNKEDSRGIFGLFKRKETSRGIEGTGLGLAIVKEIAEHHQGKVWSKSGFRKGITFYISISKHL